MIKSMLGTDSSEAGVFLTPVRAFAHFNSLVAAIKPHLSKLKMPALIIHPREDDIADISNAMYLQRHLAGPVDMVVLDDSYHIITLDKQRHIVVERTVEFAKHLEQRLGYKEPAVQPVKVNAAE